MIVPVTLTEQLLFSTIRIECSRSGGGTSVGTGFFFHFPAGDDNVIPAIVTNKHVVEDADIGSFRLHLATTTGSERLPTGASHSVTVSSFWSGWIAHPDPSVDLCAMPFQRLRTAAASEGRSIYTVDLSAELVPTDQQLEELSAVEDILMVGYPIGLWDETNNLPIFRRGITASHPAMDFNGKSMGVIDAACFPGSSGSPVMLLNESMYAAKGKGTIVGNRALLLGVLASGPQMTAEGVIKVRDLPTAKQPVPVIQVMTNLGYYVKAREVLALGQHVRRVLGK